MPVSPNDDDVPPTLPVRPGNDECCRSGCEPCIFTRYDEELERYRARLLAWQQRNAREDKTADVPSCAPRIRR